MATPRIGQIVTYKTSTTRTSPAIVSLVIDDDTVNINAFIDQATDWPVTNVPVTHPCQYYGNVPRGTDVGTWQEIV